MHDQKFVDLSREMQLEEVTTRFQYRKGAGWFTPEGSFAGKNETDVIEALIDLEEAEINAIGDYSDEIQAGMHAAIKDFKANNTW